MRCKSCDALLSPTELRTKDTFTGELLDLCDECLAAQGSIDIDDINGGLEGWEVEA
jgi:hypothetical protein